MFPSDPERQAALDADPVRDRVKRAALRQLRWDQQNLSRLYARSVRTLADLADAFDGPDDPDLILEVAGTARIGQQRAASQARDARRLREVFPTALRLLEAGVLRRGTVDILLALTKTCPDPVQAEVGRRVIGRLVELDAVDARRLVAVTIPQVEAELDPAAQQARHEQVRANRGVWAFGVADGMARIGAEVDQVAAQAWVAGFDRIVAAQSTLDQRDGVTRTQAQRRADVFAELPHRYLTLVAAIQQGRTRLTSSTEELIELLRVPLQPRVTVNVHVPVTTLLDLDQRAARLEGSLGGYLPAFQARLLVPTAALRRIAVDARTGVPLAADQIALPPPELTVETHARRRHRHDRPPDPGLVRARRADDRARQVQHDRLLDMIDVVAAHDQAEAEHDPSSILRTFVTLRDQTCRGIGCPRTATSCELDHRHDWAHGGDTAA